MNSQKPNNQSRPPLDSDGMFHRIRRFISRYRHAIGITVTLVVFALALTVCWRLLHEVNPRLLVKAFSDVSGLEVGGAILAACGSYLMLIGYEWSATRYSGVKPPWSTIILGGTCASAIGNAIGLSMLSGGAVRCRLYFRHGLTGADVARMSVFVSLALGLALPVLASVAALMDVDTAAMALEIPAPAVVWISTSVLGLYVVLLALLMTRRQAECPSSDSRLYKLGNWAWRLPSLRLSFLQLIITLGDVVGSATVLFLLLPHHPPFSTFLLIYLLALAAGVLSHVPGGIGVFEAIMLASFSSVVGAAPLTAALVLYRAIYVVLPLLLACATLLINEGRRILTQRQDIQMSTGLAPGVLSLVVFFCGLLLIASNVMPEIPQRIDTLLQWVSPVTIEEAHLVSGLMGLLCLLIARGLRRRLMKAWRIGVIAILVAMVTSMMKGMDIPQTLWLLVCAVGLILFKDSFYRKSPLKSRWLSSYTLWISAAVIVGSLWLTLFVYQDVPYRSRLWWEVSPHADMARALRSVVGTTIMLAIITAYWKLRAQPRSLTPPSARMRDHAFAIAKQSNKPESVKSVFRAEYFLFNEEFSGFIGYRVLDNYLVALGEPAGSKQAQASLRWDFRDLCEEQQCTPLFYPIPACDIESYQDIGLYPMKIAEEAVISLTPDNVAHLQQQSDEIIQQSRQLGLVFELLPAEKVDVAQLEQLSRRWVQQCSASQKVEPPREFSASPLEGYSHVAIVKKDGDIMGFAGVLGTSTASVRALDIIHFTPEGEHGRIAASWLVLNLVKESEEKGYSELSLGNVPLLPIRLGHVGLLTLALNATTSHLEGRDAMSPYGFAQRFNPRWESQYIMLPRGTDVTRALASIAEARTR